MTELQMAQNMPTEIPDFPHISMRRRQGRVLKNHLGQFSMNSGPADVVAAVIRRSVGGVPVPGRGPTKPCRIRPDEIPGI
jgi:hypothetical protein